MPVTWTVSHPARLVIAVVKDKVTLEEVQEYLDAVVIADAMPYRKIFDLSNGAFDLTDGDMMALGARIRAYAATGSMGPLAIVASSPQAYEWARVYTALAGAERPLQIFRELHLARKWLDGLASR